MHTDVIRYIPIEFDINAPATAAEIDRLVMERDQMTSTDKLTVSFSIAGRRDLVKVAFPHVELFRVIEELHLPLEESDIPRVGAITNHFAYRIQGSPFWAAQREVFETALPGSEHYRFVTGGQCLDVVSRDQPEIMWQHTDQE
ncbi:hypothetical protein JZX87_30635 [Agrobacterium sp. Ap1]|uniref:hypothetical protein n=1 Tax=Agrobacterium sp. Ap1 TaxID=2815337 RepID=UPI001A8CDA00|nr:hypothetical protein [Agrobacterium sp. Ap1]MBO0145476.1 hypothetical protein [Agrobacterium sp. Ap1]